MHDQDQIRKLKPQTVHGTGAAPQNPEIQRNDLGLSQSKLRVAPQEGPCAVVAQQIVAAVRGTHKVLGRGRPSVLRAACAARPRADKVGSRPLNSAVRRQSGQTRVMNHSIRLTDVADAAARDAIAGPLRAYNTEITGREGPGPLVLVLENSDGHPIGGLWGRTPYGWLIVELLFVPKELRGKGIGAELMSLAEREAISRGCHSAWLDTFEFQARGFYERLGYVSFAQLSDHPPGLTRYFMKKALI